MLLDIFLAVGENVVSPDRKTLFKLYMYIYPHTYVYYRLGVDSEEYDFYYDFQILTITLPSFYIYLPPPP